MNFREQLKNIYPFEGEAKNTQEKKQEISELGLMDRLKSFKSKAALAAAVAFLGTFSKMEAQTTENKNQDANKEKTEYMKTGENDGDVYKVTTKEKNKKIEGGYKYKKVIIEKGDKQNFEERDNTVDENKETKFTNEDSYEWKPIGYTPSESQKKMTDQFKFVDGKWYTKAPKENKGNTNTNNKSEGGTSDTINIDGKTYKKVPGADPKTVKAGSGVRILGGSVYKQVN